MPIPKDTLGLREASERFGVSIDTLRRRIKDDELPEAYKTEGKFGSTWVLPIAAMADVADRERWVLTLDLPGEDDEAGSDPDPGSDAGASSTPASGGPAARLPSRALNKTSTQTKQLPTGLPSAEHRGLPNHDTHAINLPSGIVSEGATVPQKSDSRPQLVEENLEWVERLLAAETRATGAETRLELMEAETAATEKRIAQLTRDLEHERAELRRLRTDLATEEKAKAVAVGRTDELRVQLKADRIDLESRIGEAKTEAQAHLERADALAARLGDAHAAMGWWSRRRLVKIDPELHSSTKSDK